MIHDQTAGHTSLCGRTPASSVASALAGELVLHLTYSDVCSMDANITDQGPLCGAGSLPNVRTIDLSENLLTGHLNMSELFCLLVETVLRA